MTVTVFYDGTGRIVEYAPSEKLTEDDIADSTPVDGGAIEVDDYPDPEIQYVLSGALVDRPTITDTLEWLIESDGSEYAWFWAPEGTLIFVTADGQDILLNGADGETAYHGVVTFSATIEADFVLDVAPPFPWQDVSIDVTAGPRDTEDPAPEAVPTRGTLTYSDLDLTYDGLTLSHPISPILEIAVTQPIPTGLTGTAKPRANVWTWDESEDPRHAFWELTLYTSEEDAEADENGTVITPILENFYREKEDLAVDDGQWARLADVDTGGNRSIKSDWETVVSRAVETTDIGAEAVTVIGGAESAGAASINATFAQMQTLTVSWGPSAKVFVFFQFRCSTSEDVDLEIRSGGTVFTAKSFRAAADVNSIYMDMYPSDAVSGVALTAWLKLPATGSADIYNRKLIAMAAKR